MQSLRVAGKAQAGEHWAQPHRVRPCSLFPVPCSYRSHYTFLMISAATWVFESGTQISRGAS
jgi:hypothetical protein